MSDMPTDIEETANPEPTVESPQEDRVVASPTVKHLTDPTHRALLGAVVDFFSTQDRDSILLEIGCGDGYWLEALRYLGFRRLFGIDVSLPLLERAADKGLDVRQGDVSDLEVDDVFDIVFICDTLEHLPNPKTTLQRTHRALRTQGMLYLAVPVYDSLAERYDRLIHRVSREEQCFIDDPGHLHTFTTDDVLALLEECHFAVDSAAHVGNLLPTTPPRPTYWTGGGRFGRWFCVVARSLFYVNWSDNAPEGESAPVEPVRVRTSLAEETSEASAEELARTEQTTGAREEETQVSPDLKANDPKNPDDADMDATETERRS